MKAVVAAFNQENALVGAFSVIVKPMEHYTALVSTYSSKLWEKNHMIAILQYKSWMLYPSFAAALFQISKF